MPLLSAPIFLSLYFPMALGQDAKLKAKLQVIAGYDNNIFEDPDMTTSDGVAGLLVSLGKKTAIKSDLSLNLNYRGGYRLYMGNPLETRFVHEMEGMGVHRLRQGGVLGAGGRLRNKNYGDDQRDYWLGHGELFWGFLLLKGIRGEVTARYSFLSCPANEFFNYSSTAMGFSLTKRLFKKLTFGVKMDLDRPFFQRNALGSGRHQVDKIYLASFSLEYYRGLLLRLSYSFENDRSNSLGYSYQRHHVFLLFAKNLTPNLMIRFYSAMQLKTYLDPIDQLLLLNLDTESREDNIFVLELSQDLSQKLSALLRIRWLRNESLYRNRFYEKRLAFIGMEYHF